jgi:hypothetical protein
VAHVQDKKDALTTLVEIERQALHESLEALRGAARGEVAELKDRVGHMVEKLDVRRTIVAHRYKFMLGAFAIGLAIGVRRMMQDD